MKKIHTATLGCMVLAKAVTGLASRGIMSDLIRSEATSSSSDGLNLEKLLSEIAELSEEIEKVKQEKADLEIMLEAMTEHANVVEEELQEEAEAARRESEERFRLIAEATPIAAIVSRLADGEILYANATARSMFGMPIEELLKRSTLDLYADPDDRSRLMGIYTKNGLLRNYEIRLKKADETIFWGAVSLQSFSLNGEKVLLSAVLDITKRKQTEVERIRFTQELKEQHAQLQRLSALKDEFLIDTSNELSAPLNGMVEIVQSLLTAEATSLSQVQQQKLSKLAQSGHQLLNLVNNIHDFSKLKHGDIKLQLQAVNLRSLADELLQSKQSLVVSKDLQLINSIPADLPDVCADRQRLQQILQNLVDYAIKFTEGGSVEISAALQFGQENEDQIGITITKTGARIPEAELEEIADIFKQTEHLASQQSESKSLGLSVVKALVELHKGKIWVESDVGFGTSFTLTLPVAASDASAATTNPTPSNFQSSLSTTPSATVETFQQSTSPASIIATEANFAEITVAKATQTPPAEKRHQNKLVRTLGQIPLRAILIVPFVVQVVGAVGLVGYLSFRNGQKAVEDIAIQLRNQVTARVRDRVQNYIEVPQTVNQFNARAVQLGLLDFQKIRESEPYFWQQVLTYETIGNVGFANARGQSTRVGWVNRQSTTEKPQIAEQLAPGGGNLKYYDIIDSDVNRTKLVKTVPNYDPRTRSYYTSAINRGKPTWSEVYINFAYNLLQIKASQPFYSSDGSLLGVLACELGINQIGELLQTLKIGRSGQVFIMEPTGELVATSATHQPILAGNSESSRRIQAVESENLLMRSSAAFLRDRFSNLKNIQQDYQLEFILKGQKQFLQVSPLTDRYGLDWLIVVVVPESDFMEQINANTRTTILLCLATSIVVIVIGILTARWVTDPLIRLNFAAKDIAKGDWEKTVDIDRSDEVGQLANSFNYMARQLKEAFEILETQKNAFARFFPPEYLKFLQKQHVMHIQLGDHVSKEMAILFSDIRAFTTLSESMTPQEHFNFVNTYLQRVSPVIRCWHGLIVKYLGDGMMAIFPDGADDAVQAGIAKLRKVREYNQELQEKGYPPIYIGLGIHIGYMMVGIVGEENRMQGDAFSDNVNLTARLEGLTKFYGVSMLISEQVLVRLKDPNQYQIRFLDRAIVKGKTEAIAVYEVMDGEPEEVKALKFQTQSDFEQGVEHYRRREFAEAKRCFEQVLAVNLADKTAQLYLERVNQLAEEGVPENWDGVWAFAQK